MELKSVNIEDYNSGTLIIHPEQDTGTMKIKEEDPNEHFSGVKNNFSEHSQYQQYVDIRKNADQAIKTEKLVQNKKKLNIEISMFNP
jgi:hypothetical protein